MVRIMNKDDKSSLLPTMKDVAKRAGVSIKTVSNVVNDYKFISEVTRQKVCKAIEELGYVVNLPARNLRLGRTGLVVLAIPDLTVPYYAKLAALIIEEAKKLGLRVLVEPTGLSREGELEALRGFQNSLVDGLIYCPFALGTADVEELKVTYPLVLLGERIFNETVDHISTENHAAAKCATGHLIESGCKKIAVIGLRSEKETGPEAMRVRGYKEALNEAGIAFDDRLVVSSQCWHSHEGEKAMNTLFETGVEPDGVVAFNDVLASGVIRAIETRGLTVPDDVSVVGFDNSEDCEHLSPKLTSIAPGLHEVARTSVQVLKDRIDGSRPLDSKPGERVFHKVTPTLVIRESSRQR